MRDAPGIFLGGKKFIATPLKKAFATLSSQPTRTLGVAPDQSQEPNSLTSLFSC